jgi:hypothetical protein
MSRSRNRGARAALLSLEADAASAREDFACMFSTSDEYESALVLERRARGRYGRSRNPWPLVAFIAFITGALIIAATVVLFHELA